MVDYVATAEIVVDDQVVAVLVAEEGLVTADLGSCATPTVSIHLEDGAP